MIILTNREYPLIPISIVNLKSNTMKNTMQI